MKTNKFPTAQINSYSLLFFLFFITVCSIGTPAKGATADTGQNNSRIEINKDALKAKIEATNTREGIDEATKSKLLIIYQAAEDNLSNVEKFKAQAAGFKASIKQAPEQTKKLQKEIELTQLKVAKQKAENFKRNQRLYILGVLLC